MITPIFQRLRYYSAIALLYGLTLAMGACIVRPTILRPLQSISVAEAADYHSAPSAKPGGTKTVSGRPVRLAIHSLRIDLPVDRGVHNPADGSWTLSDTRAQFALPSHQANDQRGMTLIYGHNNRNVFAPLYRLREGDRAEVYTHNHQVFHYRYEGYELVTPDSVSIFTYRGKPRLTLQTCSGNWDGLRRLHHFSLLKVEKLT